MSSFTSGGSRLRVAMIIKTPGLDFDDRLRRECVALSRVADVHIFTNLDSNISSSGTTSYGIPYTAVRLKSRDLFRGGQLLLLKAVELYFVCKHLVRSFDVVWCHEEYSFVCALLFKGPRVVWDLHELPEVFERGRQRIALRWIEKRVAAIVHANAERRDYALAEGLFEDPAKHTIIRNFPDAVFVDSLESSPATSEAQRWLSSDPYVYLQGVSSDARNGFESLRAVLAATDLKVIVVGPPLDKSIVSRLEEAVGSEFHTRVFQLGMTPQLATAVLLRRAMFSIVCYRHITTNDVLCEPNRFFQALALGVPVVVGNNLTMANVVNRNRCGVVLTGDGSDGDELERGVRALYKGYAEYRANAQSSSGQFVWNGSSVVDVLEQVTQLGGRSCCDSPVS